MNFSIKKSNKLILLLTLVASNFSGCKGQSEFGTNLLHLSKIISLPNVKGRIDHMDVNPEEHTLYVAALGNNTVEVVDLQNARVIHTIKDLDEPQGVAYISQTHEIFVANGGNGDCFFYDAKSFKKIATVHLGNDADDVRYDSTERKIFVGYGAGGIAIIDAGSHLQTGDVKLPGHPESFQIDKKLHMLYVNVPDAHMVGAIDLTQLKLINTWERDSPTKNFPMAIDTTQHRLFIGYRHPAKLIVMNGITGQDITSNTMAGDADDIYYDSVTKEVLISGGDGFINIFQQADNDTYKPVANISTAEGARTSLFVPTLNLFVVAARAAAGNPARLMVYQIAH